MPLCTSLRKNVKVNQQLIVLDDLIELNKNRSVNKKKRKYSELTPVHPGLFAFP